MTNISKYVALKEYIPSGDPKLSHFELEKKKLILIITIRF